jgi:CheY-like chemotaxis protein
MPKILLVEDDDNIRTIVQMSLEDEWEITQAASGMAALDVAANARPDIILLDMMMPGMDGLTTFSKLRELPAAAAIPVIFMTAKAQQHEIEIYLKTGVAGIIIKPFDPMTLSNQIREIVAGVAR